MSELSCENLNHVGVIFLCFCCCCCIEGGTSVPECKGVQGSY